MSGLFAFQYISCYGLSVPNCSQSKVVPKFQYISCYGLSKLFVAVKVWYPNFNTSHVTVYQVAESVTSGIENHFNTSHVTVYLTCRGSMTELLKISIHLMLRFIKIELIIVGTPITISIHLMLRFI